MARLPRFMLPGQPQHIIQRGNNRDIIFASNEIYRFYLEKLQNACEKYRCAIHAYVLMTNHVHILVTPMTENAVSEMMQSLGRRYVLYINKSFNRTGKLWEGRFKSSLVDSGKYLLICMQYIEMNPVRALMVDHPGEYQWSSYLFNAQNQTTDLLETHPLYEGLGASSDQRKEAYRELFNQHLDKEIINDIREALNHEIVLGRSSFKEKIKQITQRQIELGIPGRPKVEEEGAVYKAHYLVY